MSHDFRLISQIAEELWEVKDRKIVNLTKVGVLDSLPLMLFMLSMRNVAD